MYGFLFDQTYINLIILGFFLFLIMFLWRKITIIEGNYFILEKRVDMIKKTERDSLISKNIEKADIVMNEIFKDSTNKKSFCNNINYCPTDSPIKSQKTNSKNINNIDTGTPVGPVDTTKVVGGHIDFSDDSDTPCDLLESLRSNKIEIIEYKVADTRADDVIINKNVEYPEDVCVIKETFNMTADVDTDAVTDVLADADTDVMNMTVSMDSMDNDAMSVSSDITFGTDQEKSITKKYKKMSVEKLREECIEKSINSEGSKAILIAKILEYNKKV